MILMRIFAHYRLAPFLLPVGDTCHTCATLVRCYTCAYCLRPGRRVAGTGQAKAVLYNHQGPGHLVPDFETDPEIREPMSLNRPPPGRHPWFNGVGLSDAATDKVGFTPSPRLSDGDPILTRIQLRLGFMSDSDLTWIRRISPRYPRSAGLLDFLPPGPCFTKWTYSRIYPLGNN